MGEWGYLKGWFSLVHKYKSTYADAVRCSQLVPFIGKFPTKGANYQHLTMSVYAGLSLCARKRQP